MGEVTMCGKVMFEACYAYVVIGVLVALIVPALDGLWDEGSPWLYVGMAVFWPLTLMLGLWKAAKEVCRWGFGKKEA